MLSKLNDTIPASHKPYLFTVESTAQFAKILKLCNECYCFMLNFTHCIAHSGDKFAEAYQCSEQMFDELEKKSIHLCLVSLCILYRSIDNHYRYL